MGKRKIPARSLKISESQERGIRSWKPLQQIRPRPLVSSDRPTKLFYNKSSFKGLGECASRHQPPLTCQVFLIELDPVHVPWNLDCDPLTSQRPGQIAFRRPPVAVETNRGLKMGKSIE